MVTCARPTFPCVLGSCCFEVEIDTMSKEACARGEATSKECGRCKHCLMESGGNHHWEQWAIQTDGLYRVEHNRLSRKWPYSLLTN